MGRQEEEDTEDKTVLVDKVFLDSGPKESSLLTTYLAESTLSSN